MCSTSFEVQFRYQMEEKDGGFSFYCSQACHAAALRGDAKGGAVCDACHANFKVELVAQIVTVRGTRKYACGEACRSQLLAEAGGARLGQLFPVHVPVPVPMPDRVPTRCTRRIAVFNHKGGTGKTTTSVQLAAALATRGLRVLLVDTDSQGNVGVSLDVKTERSLYHVLVMGLHPKDATVNVRPNLDIIVANETLAAAELYLAGRQNRDRVLRDRLSRAEADYDAIILDCSPSLSLMNQNALVASDSIIVPVACDFLSLVGVRQVIKTVKNVNSLLHHPVQIQGVLPTFYDARARICRDALATLREHFGDRCYEPVRMATKIKEAPAQGKTVFEHAPDSTAAEDYARAAARVLGDGDTEKRLAANG